MHPKPGDRTRIKLIPESCLMLPQAILKMQITFKDKARADEKAKHTLEYVSILKRLVTQ
jgi:hypothetical protein